MRKTIVHIGSALLLMCGTLAVFLLARAALMGEGAVVDRLSRPGPTPLYTRAPTPMPIVEYSVTGTARSVSLYYTNATGGKEQISNKSLPWKLSFRVSDWTFLYLSARNLGQSGTVTATIRWKGSVIETATSEGGHVTATVSGSVP